MAYKKKATIIDRTHNDGNGQDEKRVRQNIILIILCFVAAFILWLYVMEVESPEYEQEISMINVELENKSALQKDSELSVYSVEGGSISIRVSGKKSIVGNLKSDDIYAYADLSSIKYAGSHAVEISVKLPEGVQLVDVYPKSVTVLVDETYTDDFDITDRKFNLHIAAPYYVGNVELQYDVVTVTGPRRIVSQISKAQVAIDMKNMTTTFTQSCDVDLIMNDGKEVSANNMKYLSLSVSDMEVTVPIYKTKDEKVEVDFKNGIIDDSLVEVTVSPAIISVSGDTEKLKDNSKVLDKIIIDEKNIESFPYTVTAGVKTQVPGVTVNQDENQTVTVTVELRESVVSKTFICDKFEIIGASDKSEYQIITDKISVTLIGKSDVLEQITSDDIIANIDISGYAEGSEGVIESNAEISVNAKQNGEVFALGAHNVKFEIKSN